ncbi:ML-236A carboxylate methylbutanoyltransferase mlcH like protein [Verticillium longisporum]|uniref:ML-236A carboxylate methylbutanoyltransferase mlcH like protein n=2 Tax=Verticillium longisporum TaxID=100787 RepID=A0A8I2ZKF7_VERLO|nr:ML-236A carboxylate methylbutanoyltransferase mlcH like protein [Verticillium longisporum]KAG7131279.1 ML-236A carboxylate methylbutanoyltransferase mlcH like protein [Verticillium longisporum]
MGSFEEIVESLRHPQEGLKQPLPRVTLGAINRDGSFHYSQAFGEEVDDITETDAVHLIASATKLVTTVAVMQCVEKGLLDLDADVSKILPEWENPQILTGFDENDVPLFRPSEKAITLRHLLTHSSGMTYTFMEPLLTRYAQLPTVEPRNPHSVKEKFFTLLVFEPGSRWKYSPGVDWAGLMVERVTSMRLGDYMKRHIFDPVSAKDITFHMETRGDLQPRLVNQWGRYGESLRRPEKPLWPAQINEDLGGGGLYATVSALLNIYQGILNGKLLHPATVEAMFQPQLKSVIGLESREGYSSSYLNAVFNTVPANVSVNFGLGGLINLGAIPNRRAARSLTWSGMPNCYWWVDLENGVAGVYLSQLVPTGDEQAVKLLAKFEEFVYASLDDMKHQ